MDGFASGSFRRAHADSAAKIGAVELCDREAREEREEAELAPGATRAHGAGRRARLEEPDPVRTCFERDRDRILHGTTAFRRLAGKTQVFVFPEDHQRTRLTHALEVAQVATSIAAACRLNVALTEAIALGHDCGHGPFGHASEDAFTPYVAGGFDHAVWGADVVLEPVNLCAETLDGIRNHSWSRPAPGTPEGEVVSWADRIAYVAHDFEDAVRAGIVTPAMLPASVRERCGARRSRQLHAFIGSVVGTAFSTGEIGMETAMAEALAEFRAFNYDRIYMRPESVAQGEAVVRVLHALVEHYAGSGQSLREAVTYVAGMTDRFAFTQAVAHLGWDPASLPAGLDVAIGR
jgi:dGTPase